MKLFNYLISFLSLFILATKASPYKWHEFKVDIKDMFTSRRRLQSSHGDQTQTLSFTKDNFIQTNVDVTLSAVPANTDVIIELEDGEYTHDVSIDNAAYNYNSLLIRPKNPYTASFNMSAEVCSSPYVNFESEYLALNSGAVPSTLSSTVTMDGTLSLTGLKATVDNLKMNKALGVTNMDSINMTLCIFKDFAHDVKVLDISGFLNDITFERNVFKNIGSWHYVNTYNYKPNRPSNVTINCNYMEGVKGIFI